MLKKYLLVTILFGIFSSFIISPQTDVNAQTTISCPDTNGDGRINSTDQLIVLKNYGSITPNNPADVNHDGKVNSTDQLIILQNYGKTCPSTLIVINHVINDSGGTLNSADFNINVTGTNVAPSSFTGQETPGTVVSLSFGSFSIDSSFNPTAYPPGYIKTLGENCVGTIKPGETKTCIITNDDNSPYLFSDDFNGLLLDSNKWDIYSYPGSIISEDNGYLTLGATFQQYSFFPFIQTRNPINTTINYNFTVKFRYENPSVFDSSRPFAEGIMIGLSSIKYDPNYNFGNSPFINATTAWMYNHINGLGVPSFTLGTYPYSFAYIPYDDQWHTMEVKSTGMYPGDMKVYFDNQLVGSNTVNLSSPQYLFIGIPGSLLFDGAWNQYPNLILDYINIK